MRQAGMSNFEIENKKRTRCWKRVLFQTNFGFALSAGNGGIPVLVHPGGVGTRVVFNALSQQQGLIPSLVPDLAALAALSGCRNTFRQSLWQLCSDANRND